MASDWSSRRGLYRQLEELAGGDAALDISADFLSSVLTHVPAVISVLAPDGRLLFLNRTVTGASMDDFIGSTVYDLVPDKEEHGDIERTLASIVATGEPGGYVAHALGVHGPRSRYHNWLGPIRSGGKVIALTCITRDVTAAWQAESALADQEARLRMALEAAGMGMWRWDVATNQTEIDDAARAIYRHSGNILTPEDLQGLIHREDRPLLDAAALESIMSRVPYSMPHRLVRDGDPERWLMGKGLPLYDDAGNVEGMLGTIVDITEHRALEEQLRQAQKLEAVGQLTAGIAHNFNNMLASILPALERVADDVSPENRPLIAAATEATQRAASMIRELLTFSGKNRPAPRRLQQVHEIVEKTLHLCRSTFDRAISIEFDVQGGLGLVQVDAAQVEQALLNILINARDALAASNTASPFLRIAVHAGDRPADPQVPDHAHGWVCVTVTDNADGMEDEVRARIFDPFFTTKGVGRGTGLGLSTSYAIVREHGGLLNCDSRPGEGSTFVIWLPVVEPGQSPAAEAGTPARRRQTSADRSVLVVDDEAVVRRVLVQLLGREGYAVQKARHADDAIALLEEHGAVDLVLLDLNMPGMPFTEFIAHLDRVAPGARRIVYTGDAGVGELEGVDVVIQKPAGSDRILREIETLLAAAAPDRG
ncbi:MAG: PAS domain-containing protein [Deltaproteobacteria bacterium]|nr:PAS domain-containing protein [Deltaproteobacteria bacterium]